MEKNSQSLKSRFNKYDTDRQAVLSRARKCSELTIPSLFPPEDSDDNTKFTTPYQGLGAIGVNNLASKLLLTLLPPNQPFFKLSIDDFTLKAFSDEKRADVERALNRIERAIFSAVETKAIRVPVFTALRQLIVTGNAATFQPEDGGMKVFRLDQYVVDRDSMGNLIELIIKESISPSVLPESIRDAVLSKDYIDDSDNSKDKNKELEIYTQIKLSEDGKEWEHKQEVKGEVIPESVGTFKYEENPYQVLRWSHDVGTDYGRGFVEEYLGDLMTLESLSQAITEDSVIASRIVFLVNPSGMTNAKKFKEAKNGDVIEGVPEDIGTAKIERASDLQLVLERIDTLERRLSRAFLMFEAIQRDAERVTAEEIRRLARELENTLGGVYSILTQEFQLPLIKKLMLQMEKNKQIPKLPDEVATPKVVTGIDGLGRGNDLEHLMTFGELGTQISPDAFSHHVDMHDYFTRVGTALGFDMDGLLKDPETLEQEEQGQMTAELLQQILPQATQGAIGEQIQQGGEQGGQMI